MVQIRDPWTRKRVNWDCPDPSMTDQSHTTNTDVNFIVTRYLATGYMPPPTREPIYGDTTLLTGDPRERLERAAQAIERAQAETAEAHALKAAADKAAADAAAQKASTPAPNPD